MDCEGIAKLMRNGFSLQEAMALLEDARSGKAFGEIRNRLSSGESLSDFFPSLCPGTYRTYLSGFLRCLNFADSLALCSEVVSGERAQRKEYLNGLFYPCLMFLCTLFGVILFNEVCFPPLLSMMESFHVESQYYTLIRILIRILSGAVIVLILIFLALLAIARSSRWQVKAYRFISKYRPSSIYTQYETTDFIRFFLQCIRMKVPTKESIRILRAVEHKPVIRFLAKTMEQALLAGDTFESAVDMPWLDPSLIRFMKIALYSSEMETMLEGYLEMSRERSRRQCRRITRMVQILSYASIGVVLVLVYQILMLPMMIFSRM